MDDKEFNKKYESLKKSKFKQQKLLGWRPIPTISCITIIFISFAVFFILFGIIILVFTSQVKEVISRYDNVCNKTECSFELPIPEKMEKPIMIYYQIDEFSQNHRVYMDSKSDKQLNGEEVQIEDLKESGVCDNAITRKDMGETDIAKKDKVAFPCGLMAQSYFRDDFIFKKNGENITIKKEDIAYKTDKEKFEKNPYDPNKHWTNMTDEHFMIWMRPSPFPNPRKLWGIIDEMDLDSSISVTVKKHYYFMNYKKFLILSTRNVFGGKNSFLGAIYLIFGIICLVSAIVFINLHHIYHKKD